MTHFLLSVIDDTTNSATGDEMAAIDIFNDGLRANGHWIFAAGVGHPDSAVTIDARGVEPMATPGPFVATSEYVAGFWVIEAASQSEALALAAEGSRACNRKVEVRPFLG